MFILSSVTIDETSCNTLGNLGINAGMERVMLGASSNHLAEFVALMRQLPRFSFTTRKIDLLDEAYYGSASLFFTDVEQGGTRDSSGVSFNCGANCLVLPRMVSWSPGAPAMLSVEVFPLSADGSTAAITAGVSAGATDAETDVWVGSGTGVRMLEVNFGYRANFPKDGNLYQVNAFIEQKHPMIRSRTVDKTAATTANMNPGSISALSAVFAKIADGGVRGATRTYAGTGHYHVEGVSGGKPGEVELVCAVKNDLTIS